MSETGAIGLATVSGVHDVLILKSGDETQPWISPMVINDRRMHLATQVTDFRPLYLADRTRQVVLDPEDLNDVGRFLKLALWGWDQIRVEDYNPTDRSLLGAQARLRRLLKKPVPPEPEGDVILIDRFGTEWNFMAPRWRARNVALSMDWHELSTARGPITVYRKEEG